MLAFGAWLDSADDVRSPLNGLLGVRRGLSTGEALKDDAGVGVYEKIGDGVIVGLSAQRLREAASYR